MHYVCSIGQPAFLLVGPTGSGKTPLGTYLENAGYKGKRCRHLDFGESLRDLARAGDVPPGLSNDDVSFVSEVLEGGALLEKERFYIAACIIDRFIGQKKMSADQYLVLNGLPRHVQQAKDVDSILDVQQVLYLSCTHEVVHQRIRMNAGGDRAGRKDDTPEEVRQKLKLFERRTIPLLEYYESRGVPIHRINIDLYTTPDQIIDAVTA